MDFDTALSEAGELGLWQWGVLLLLVPAALLPGMWSVLFVFAGYVPKHRCKVENCDDEDEPGFYQPWLNFTLPPGSTEGEYDPCLMYKRVENSSSSCFPTSFSSTTTTTCSSYVFDKSIFSSTVPTEFSLVCDQGEGQLLVDLGQSMYSVGVLFGVLLPGFLSDRFGRKKMMFLSMGIAAIATLASAYVHSYPLFLMLRVFSGVGTLGTFVTMCILAVEITGPRHKSLVGNLVHLLWAPGQMLLALLAYTIRDWRQLQIAVAIPVFVALLLYPITPESPRWLAAVGKLSESRSILHTVAKLNGGRAPSSPLSTSSPAPGSPQSSSPPQTPFTLLSLISSPGLAMTTIVLSLNWLVVDFCYYGLSLHSVNLAGDIFLNFVLSAAVEMPAVVVGMIGMDCIGRVSLLVTCQLIGGISCILAGLTSAPFTLVFALIGKAASSIVFLTVYLYTAEVYPTQVRGLGLALTATAARIGGFVAPFIAGLGVRDPSLPFLIFGGAAVVGGVAGALLPETRGHPLPSSLEDVEDILKSRGCRPISFFRRTGTLEVSR